MTPSLFGIIKGLLAQNEADRTKQLEISVPASVTTNTKTTLQPSQTDDRTIILPDFDTTLVGTDSAQTLTNKTIDADSNTIINLEDENIKAAAAIDASKIADGSVSNTEFEFINSVTSNVQTQINTIATSVGNITGSNVGTGEGNVFKQRSGDTLQFKTIKAGSGITVTDNTDDITIASTGGASANTALSNLASVNINTDLIFDNSANHELKVAATSTTAGKNLSLTGGDSGSGTNLGGGSIIISSGSSTGNSGGDVNIKVTPSLQGSGTSTRVPLNALIINADNTTNNFTFKQSVAGSPSSDLVLTNGTSGVSLLASPISSGSAAPAMAIESASNISSGAGSAITIKSGGSSSGVSGATSLSSANTTGTGSGTITVQSGTVTTGTSGSLTIQSGAASGAGTSGNVTVIAGTTSGGTRGKIRLQEGSQGTIGHIWTSTDTSGSGHWAAGSGGSQTLTQTAITYNSNDTLIIPAGVTTIEIEGCGGGGGGGGGGGNSGAQAMAGGGGGGGGAPVLRYSTTVTPSDTLTITIASGGTGASGSAGTGPTRGNDGGTSSITGTGVALYFPGGGGGGGGGGGASTAGLSGSDGPMGTGGAAGLANGTAGGGGGGGGGFSGSGADGGTTAGSASYFSGGNGRTGNISGTTGAGTGGLSPFVNTGAAPGTSVSSNGGAGGGGGASFAVGGAGANGNTSSAGSAAAANSGAGGGGGGGRNSASSLSGSNGGNGGSGRIIIYYQTLT